MKKYLFVCLLYASYLWTNIKIFVYAVTHIHRCRWEVIDSRTWETCGLLQTSKGRSIRRVFYSINKCKICDSEWHKTEAYEYSDDPGNIHIFRG